MFTTEIRRFATPIALGKVTSLLSVFCRALGKAFTECPTLGKVRTEKT
jgi:hypothetical protein